MKGDSLEGFAHTPKNNPHILPFNLHFATKNGSFIKPSTYFVSVRKLEKIEKMWLKFLTEYMYIHNNKCNLMILVGLT